MPTVWLAGGSPCFARTTFSEPRAPIMRARLPFELSGDLETDEQPTAESGGHAPHVPVTRKFAWEPPPDHIDAPSVWPPLGALAMRTAQPKTQASEQQHHHHRQQQQQQRYPRPPQHSPSHRPRPRSAAVRRPPLQASQRPSSASIANAATRRELARSSAAWAAALAIGEEPDEGSCSCNSIGGEAAASDSSGSPQGGDSHGGDSSGVRGRLAPRNLENTSSAFLNRDGVPNAVALRRSIARSEAVDVEAAMADLGIDYAGIRMDDVEAARSADANQGRLQRAQAVATSRAPPSAGALKGTVVAGTLVSRPEAAVADREAWLAAIGHADANANAANEGAHRGLVSLPFELDAGALAKVAKVRRDVGVPLQLFDDEVFEHRTPTEWMELATPVDGEVKWLGKVIPTDPRVLATDKRAERAEAARRVQAAQRGARVRRERMRYVEAARRREEEKLARASVIQMQKHARRRAAQREVTRRRRQLQAGEDKGANPLMEGCQLQQAAAAGSPREIGGVEASVTAEQKRALALSGAMVVASLEPHSVAANGDGDPGSRSWRTQTTVRLRPAIAATADGVGGVAVAATVASIHLCNAGHGDGSRDGSAGVSAKLRLRPLAMPTDAPGTKDGTTPNLIAAGSRLATEDDTRSQVEADAAEARSAEIVNTAKDATASETAKGSSAAATSAATLAATVKKVSEAAVKVGASTSKQEEERIEPDADGILRPQGGGQLQGKALLW